MHGSHIASVACARHWPEMTRETAAGKEFVRPSLLRRRQRPVGRLRPRVVGVLEPGPMPTDGDARAWVHSRCQRYQRDAFLDRADDCTQIAADALLLDHLVVSLAVAQMADRLVAGVLAGDVAAAALNALGLIDVGLD